MAIGVLPLIYHKSGSPASVRDKYSRQKAQLWVYYFLFVFGFTICIPPFLDTINSIPPDITQSDIIPQIQIMVRRFFYEGSFPYEPIYDFGYEIHSPYMPLQWGPFAIPEAMGIDYRWLSLVVFTMAIGYTIWAFRNEAPASIYAWLTALMPGIFLLLILRYYNLIIGQNIELLIVGYYIFLAVSLMRNAPILQAIAISCCLLSKYYLAVWLPLYAWILWRKHSRETIWKASAIILTSMLFIYILPFLSRDWTILSNGINHHLDSYLSIWSNPTLRTGSGKPIILAQGVGLATYFFEYWPGEIADRIQALQLAQLLTGLLAIATLAYLEYRKRFPDTGIFLLASLKIYLSLYFHLNPMPFAYYFLTLVFCSFVLYSSGWAFSSSSGE